MEITIKVEMTSVFMGTGKETLIQFSTFQQWVNKAANWVREKDTLIDSEGRVIRNGKDAKAATYPVSVYRMVGAGE